MNYKLLLSFLFCFFAFAKANSQVVINELDTDTPSTDDKEFVELLTSAPFTSLDGYVMVFFNGSASFTSGMGRSYYAVNLDGLVTDENGLIVLGSSQVSPVPDFLLAESNIQNGADAVAIYRGSTADFPEFTFATTTNLVSALVYDTNDADSVELLTLLGETVQYNEAQGGDATVRSIQRKIDGTYETRTPPTPHSLNDAAIPSYVGLSYEVSASSINEGETLTVVFTLTRPLTTDFTANFTLINGGFTTADYTGPTSVTFQAGQTAISVDFVTINDALDEGDEIIRIDLDNNVPSGIKRLKDNQEVIVVDDDFIVSTYGTPINPTYDMVQSTAPSDYYNSLDNLSSPQLEQAITNLIAKEGTVRIHTYNDITEILKKADRSPLNSNKVWLLYTEQQRSIIDFQTGSSNVGKWNREHIYPQSRGGYRAIEYDDIADGIDIFTNTNVDSLRHGFSDAHHLRAADGPENSRRNNSDYPQYNGPANTLGSWRGDVARALFYMDLRYNGLALVNGDPADNTVGQLGDLATLIQWHRQDPADDFEMNRNNVIFNWQVNRNPFIDKPELVEFIYGNRVGESFTLGNNDVVKPVLKLYPNPSISDTITISGIEGEATIAIYDVLGRIVTDTRKIENNVSIKHNLNSGTYFIQVSSQGNRQVLKLIVE